MSVTRQTFPLVTDERNQDDRIIGALIKRVGLGWPGLAIFRKSLRVGSGAATLAAFDGLDGTVSSDGAAAGFAFRDRADATKYALWYENGTVRLNTPQGGDLWQINATTGLLAQPAILTVGGTGVAFANSFTNYGLGWQVAGYYKDTNGTVHLRGAVKGGAAVAVAFTLPVGYRPTAFEGRTGLFFNGAYGQGDFYIDTAGGVTVVTATTTATTFQTIACDFDTR